MDQSEFSVAGAMGNSNALVKVKSVVPFLPASPPVSSRIFFLAPVSLCCERTLLTDQKGTAYSLTGSLKLKQVLPKTGTLKLVTKATMIKELEQASNLSD